MYDYKVYHKLLSIPNKIEVVQLIIGNYAE